MELANLYVWCSVAWIMFSRAMRLSSDSKLIVVFGVSAVGTLAIAKAVAPFVASWNQPVHGMDLLLGSALLLKFFAFTPIWSHGAPPETFDAASQRQKPKGRQQEHS